MEYIYTAYTRVVNDVNFYFVKKYSVYPEYEGLPKVLDSIGMHQNFYSACFIAKIYDEVVVGQLLDQLNVLPEPKEVPVKRVKAITHSLLKNTQQIILKLRLAGVN